MGKKITQLATITEVADDDLIVGVDVSDTSGSDNGTNKKFTKATLLAGLAPLGPQLTGWNPDAETWVYHDVDDPTGYFKIEGKDVSANYSVGWRIMFTNGGNVIKGIITAITYSDPDTIITFLHEIDPTDNQALYLLQNSAITENYCSPHKAPLGFPLEPSKWSVKLEDTTNRKQASPSGNTYYNLGSLSLSVPIGSWHMFAQAFVGHSIVGNCDVRMGMSLSSSSYTSGWPMVEHNVNAVTNSVAISLNTKKDIDFTSKTIVYLVAMTRTGGTEIAFYGSGTIPTLITATCAYL